MAGHSHSANIKWRKDRQDSARSQIFVKLRKKLENILREEGKISEKSLSLARENQFPKERVYQIWEKISQEKNSTSNFPSLYQARFGIIIYLESTNKAVQEVVNQLNLKKLPLVVLSNYFQLIYSLKIAPKEENSNLEECLLSTLPLEIWEKVNYDKQERTLSSSNKETIKGIKNTFQDNSLIMFQGEKKSWKIFLPKSLSAPEEKKYYSQLQKKLENVQFHTNVEK